jgi:branched-chain amino acid transport system permease protein
MTRVRLFCFAIGAAVVAVAPFLLSDFRSFELAKVGIYFIAVIGLNVLTGYTGQISLGHGAFMAIGAYTTAILTVKHDWNDLATIPVAGLVAGTAGFLFGFPALRFAGVYLALATFAVPVAVVSLAKRFEGFTGGGGGLVMHLPKAELGLGWTTNHWLYYLTWTVAGVLLLTSYVILDGRSGRAFRAVRDSEVAAVSSGINLSVWKTLAFGISAFYAGVAGSLLAIASAFVNPDTFPLSLSILLLVGVVVGGLGSLGGTIFGALFIAYVPLYSSDILDWLSGKLPGVDVNADVAGVPSVVYGVILLLVLFLLPSGAGGLLNGLFRPWWRRSYSPNQPVHETSEPVPTPSGPVTSPRSET